MGLVSFSARFSTCIQFCVLLAIAVGSPANASQPIGLASDKVVITDKLERQKVDADSITAVLQNCMPNIVLDEDLRNWSFDTTNRMLRIRASERDKSFMIVEGDQAVCIQETVQGFPVLPTDALMRRTSFVHMDAQNWMRLVSQQLAKNGNAELVIADPKVGMSIFTYKIIQGQKGWLSVTVKNFKPEEIKPAVNATSIYISSPVMVYSIVWHTRYAGMKFNPVNREDLKLEASSAPISIYSKPPPPIVTERSLLIDLPPEIKQ